MAFLQRDSSRLSAHGRSRRRGVLVVITALVTSVVGFTFVNPANADTATVGPIDFEDYRCS